MSELGARLRQARESQGLSLAQASVDTRILQQSLVALEEGAYQRLPSDVVIRGFIRNYAHYLGLPVDELIETYRRERGDTDKIRIRPATTSPPRTRSYVLPSFFGVFFVTIALIGLAYVVLSAAGRIGDRTANSADVVATVTVAPPSPLPTSLPSPSGGRATAVVVPTSGAPTAGPVLAVGTAGLPAGGAAPSATPAGGPSATPAAPIVLEVAISASRGNENSWVRVQTDGNTAFEGIMRAGEKQVFQAQRRILIRAGNPTDVFVTVNGLQQGSLGQTPGQPVNWSWPPS